jgi:hypothetical protein
MSSNIRVHFMYPDEEALVHLHQTTRRHITSAITVG